MHTHIKKPTQHHLPTSTNTYTISSYLEGGAGRGLGKWSSLQTTPPSNYHSLLPHHHQGNREREKERHTQDTTHRHAPLKLARFNTANVNEKKQQRESGNEYRTGKRAPKFKTLKEWAQLTPCNDKDDKDDDATTGSNETCSRCSFGKRAKFPRRRRAVVWGRQRAQANNHGKRWCQKEEKEKTTSLLSRDLSPRRRGGGARGLRFFFSNYTRALPHPKKQNKEQQQHTSPR